jgi:hypothetical protein
MSFGESGESTPYQGGDKSTRLDKSEGARRATRERQQKLEREAAKALERKKPNNNNGNRNKRLLGDLALDGVNIYSDPRFE